eukprot:5544135-Pyramimonas_sp.AAC.1
MGLFLLLEACCLLGAPRGRVCKRLGHPWGCLEAVVGGLDRIVPRVGRPDSLCEPSWPVLEPSWDRPAAFLGPCH